MSPLFQCQERTLWPTISPEAGGDTECGVSTGFPSYGDAAKQAHVALASPGELGREVHDGDRKRLGEWQTGPSEVIEGVGILLK